MKMRLITYRTKDAKHNDYAVLPDLYVSDFVDWVKISDGRVVSNTDIGISDFMAPDNWPSYSDCADHVRISDLLRPTGR